MAIAGVALLFEGTSGQLTHQDFFGHTVATDGAVILNTSDHVVGSACADIQIPNIGVRVSGGAELIPLTNDFTYEGWYKVRSSAGAGAYNLLFQKGDWGQSDSLCFVMGDTSAKVWLGGAQRIDVPHTIALEQWFHWALVREAGTLTLFLNGAVASVASAPQSISSASDLRLFTSPPSSGSLSVAGAVGRVDEFYYLPSARYSGPFNAMTSSTRMKSATATGTVKLDGVAVPRRVVAFDRDFGVKVAEVVSAPSGAFSLPLQYLGGNYYLVILPEAADTANALIFDYLT